MAKDQIILNQVDLALDELISHLFSLKKTVADLREKMAEVSTTAISNNPLLTDQQVAKILNRREQTRLKRIHG